MFGDLFVISSDECWAPDVFFFLFFKVHRFFNIYVVFFFLQFFFYKEGDGCWSLWDLHVCFFLCSYYVAGKSCIFFVFSAVKVDMNADLCGRLFCYLWFVGDCFHFLISAVRYSLQNFQSFFLSQKNIFLHFVSLEPFVWLGVF